MLTRLNYKFRMNIVFNDNEALVVDIIHEGTRR